MKLCHVICVIMTNYVQKWICDSPLSYSTKLSYIENGNRNENDLSKYGLHLLNSGKKNLSHNFIVNLEMYGTILETRTCPPNVGRCKILV